VNRAMTDTPDLYALLKLVTFENASHLTNDVVLCNHCGSLLHGPEEGVFWEKEAARHRCEGMYKVALAAALDRTESNTRPTQSYAYIGKGGKPRQARDMEDEIDALGAELKQLREALGDANELAHGVSVSDNRTMAMWGHRVGVGIRVALAGVKP
jgi:predicted  nucleic acid-binding Zn-ribbon protein